jgi:hypothetical protein
MMIPKVSLVSSLLLTLVLLATSNCHVQAQQQHHRPRRGRRLQKNALKKDATATSMPLQSAAPTQAPTVSTAEAVVPSIPATMTAIDASFVEECVAVVTAKSEFVETNKSVMVRYEYELLVLFQLQQADQDVDLAIAIAAATVDEAVQNYLIEDLLLPAGACNGSRRLKGTSSTDNNYHRHLQAVNVTAITQGDADTIINTTTCILEAMMLTPLSALERCFRMEGSFRVYLREDSAINTDEVEAESIRQQALASVERGFRDGLISLGGGSTLAAHYLGPAEVPMAVVPDDPNNGTADSSIAADQGSLQQDAETTTTTQGDQVDDAAETTTTTQGNQVDDTSETTAQGDQVDDAAETTTQGNQGDNASETAPSATTTQGNQVYETSAETTATTKQGNQLDDITAGITPITATTTQGKQVDDNNGSITNADTSPQDSQGQESGLEQQTSITNPSPDKNSSGGLFSVNVTIFLTLGGILGLVGAVYAGKRYYRRARLFGRGVDKNFDDDSLDGHEQYPAVKLNPSDTTMNTSSGYSANEPGTEDFLRDLEGFKTFDTPSKGSSSGSSINLSGDADMLSLSLMGMALMSHNATKIFD